MSRSSLLSVLMGLALLVPAHAQVDLSGVWADRITEDSYERSGGPPLGDYQGIPLNDAGRMKADSHDHSEWSLPEFQCRPHPGPYQWRALGAVRISEEIDPVSRELTAFHFEYLRSMERPVFMDGRPHPPDYAPHTWSGFSTGKWQGNMLVITTTHLKGAYLRRNGASFSDNATMMEYITRHGDYLLVTMIITDPVWLEEPLIQTTNYQLDPHTQLSYYPCTVSEENISTAVPHFLPGQNPNLGADDIPQVAARGGAESTYPEYRLKLKSGLAKEPHSTPVAAKVAPAPLNLNSAEGEIKVLPVQGNVYMLVGDGANIAASIGRDGILLVDTGTAAMSTRLMSKVLELATAIVSSPATNRCVGLHCPGTPYGWSSPSLNAIISSPGPPKPVRFIINTSVDSDHTGGNERLAALPADSKIVGVTFPPVGIAPGATVITHENVLKRMSEPGPGEKPAPSGALPTDTFHTSGYKLSEFFNGEGVRIIHQPAAHTDGDSMVFFRYSDVIVAGDILNTNSYPVIDVAKGGTIQGVLDGLNSILDLAIPEFRSQGGTMVIPGHGRLCDTGDVANYRNMVAIMRDRIQDLKKKGMTLEQVKAAKPTFDYDGLYGSDTGPWTTSMFIEAVYRTLNKSTQEAK
ncbi:MAG TPA: MBL fold metallo-hydrolase [Bryobacteraceae bacterium]|nr:MBL fold metallo-hydrolase [Bryobacteraceae bacterium]